MNEIKQSQSRKEAERRRITRKLTGGTDGSTLERFLSQTVSIPAHAGGTVEIHPEFRVSFQGRKQGGVHFIIHVNGHNSETLDFVANGDQIKRLGS